MVLDRSPSDTNHGFALQLPPEGYNGDAPDAVVVRRTAGIGSRLILLPQPDIRVNFDTEPGLAARPRRPVPRSPQRKRSSPEWRNAEPARPLDPVLRRHLPPQLPQSRGVFVRGDYPHARGRLPGRGGEQGQRLI